MEEIDPARFETLIAAYGADPGRWPDAERPAALRRLLADPRARALAEDARALDGLLGAWPTPQPSADLTRKIAAARPLSRPFGIREMWMTGAALAAACAAGVIVGAALGKTDLGAGASDREGDAAVSAALDSSAEFTPNLNEALNS